MSRYLGVGQNTLHKWKRLFLADSRHGFPGNGKVLEYETEMRRLKRDLKAVGEMKFEFIDQHKQTHPVESMCLILGVTAAGYYRWRKQGQSKRAHENEFLLEKIKDVYWMNQCVYGSPRITQVLNRQSLSCSQARVARLMRANGLVAKTQRKFKATTDSTHRLPVAPDRVGQYASNAFRRLLSEHQIKQSMSGKGSCYDNAMAESFFKTLKTELIDQTKYETRQEATQDLSTWRCFTTAKGYIQL